MSPRECAGFSRPKQPFWAYDGRDASGFRPEWESLEDGLQFLLTSLASRKDELAALSRDFRAIWWCGHFQSSFDGGPTLSADLLAKIAGSGVPLFIDNYFSDGVTLPGS